MAPNTQMQTTPARGMGCLLLIGALSLWILGAWARHLTFSQGFFFLREDQHLLGTVPAWQVALTLLGAGLGMLGLVLAILRPGHLRNTLHGCGRWCQSHPWWSCLLAAGVVLGAVDVYEIFYDPFNKQWGPYGYRVRDDMQNWLWFGSALLGGLGWVTLRGDRWTRWLTRWDQALAAARPSRLLWGAVVVIPIILGALMCRFSLGGIPHFSDSLTYLMQGRILYTGSLWIPSPPHPELFIHSLFFLDTDGRFYGKYPLGWPAILGTFDHFHLRFLANATLAGLATLITGLVARELAGRKVGILAAILFGLSPWVWFHGAGFASHVASTCAVWGFLGLFLASWRKLEDKQRTGPMSDLPGDALPPRCGKALPWGLAAGLCLGAAVLIRPGDATNFALPAMVVVLIGLVRAPKKWLPVGALIACGALVGVGIYLWSNAQTTGEALTSPYKLEARWADDWKPTLGSMLGRFAFQWAELNSRFPGWGMGGLTLALLGSMAWMRRQGEQGVRRGPWIMVLAAVSLFFLFNTTFGFTNVWWGPRWLLPAAPLIAILTGLLVEKLLSWLPVPPKTPRDLGRAFVASLWLAILMAGMILVGPASYLAKCWEVNALPPHGVTHAVHQRVTAMGIKDAVIGMSTAGGLVPPDARSGMVNMAVPFEGNPVIYVRAIPDWPAKAASAYPGRRIYEIVADPYDPKGFSVKELNPVRQ